MKIGILSMQRIYNYGSFLQSYALKTILERRGHEVTFVDIEKRKNYTYPRKSKLQVKLGKLKYVDRYFFRRMEDSKKNTQLDVLFRTVQREGLGLSDEHMSASGLDAVVIGSDEIFNCSPVSMWGITGQRFGDIEGVGKTLSYAASCGYTCVDDMDDDDRALVSGALKKLDGISVRDDNTADFVRKLTGKEPEMNLDPVLVYDFEKEIAQGEREGVPDYPYMVVYAYHNRIESKSEIKAIKDYAKKKSLKTIAIGGSLPWCDEFAVISPFQVLAYFKHAECIVTDTFHGSVMASKLNRPLAVLVRDSNTNKLDDLLRRLIIENHKVVDTAGLEGVLSQSDDYSACNQKIEQECAHTVKYFDEIGL